MDREQDGPELVDRHERGGRLRGRGQQARDPIPGLDPEAREHVRDPVGGVLDLAEGDVAPAALPVLPHHRERVIGMLVQAVRRDVVAVGHLPVELGDHLLVRARLPPAVGHVGSHR